MFDRFTEGKDTTFFCFAKNYLFNFLFQSHLWGRAAVFVARNGSFAGQERHYRQAIVALLSCNSGTFDLQY
jgi:hypothetical protein